MIQVVDVYDIEKFLSTFPFEKRFIVREYSIVARDYKMQMNRDWHRLFAFTNALNWSLSSYSPATSIKFKIVMIIK